MQHERAREICAAVTFQHCTIPGSIEIKRGWLALSVNNVVAYSAKRLLVSRIGVAGMKATFSDATTGHTSPLPFDLASRLFRRASRVRHLFRVTRLSACSTPSSRSNLSLIARNRGRGDFSYYHEERNAQTARMQWLQREILSSYVRGLQGEPQHGMTKSSLFQNPFEAGRPCSLICILLIEKER